MLFISCLIWEVILTLCSLLRVDERKKSRGPLNESDEDNQGNQGGGGGSADADPGKGEGKNEFEKLISAYTAPMPNQKVILSDFEAKDRQKKNRERDKRVHHEVVQDEIQDDASEEYSQLQSYMIREFTIHILQSIHFLQNMD